MPEEGLPSSKKEHSEEEIGEVVGFFAIPSVGIVKIGRGSLKVGDMIWIHGHTTDLKQAVTSMEVDHKPVSEAKAGQEVGIKLSVRVRRNDRVYKISP